MGYVIVQGDSFTVQRLYVDGQRYFAEIGDFLVELFWTVQVYRKKKLRKSHDYCRFFLKKSAD